MSEETYELSQEDLDSIKNTVQLLGMGATFGDIRGITEDQYEAVYTLGFNLYEQGRYEDAQKAFTFLVMNRHLERRYLFALASCLQMREHYHDALRYYLFAVALDNDEPTAVYHMGECYAVLGLNEYARDAFDSTIALCESPDQMQLRQRASIARANLDSPKAANHKGERNE